MIRVACATDDGKNFINRHFGDAAKYVIYDVNAAGFRYITSIENNSEEEEHKNEHGAEVKAKQVMMLLAMSQVQVVMNRAFGPNINRIKIRFLPVITKRKSIEDGLKDIISNLKIVEDGLFSSREKKHLNLSNIEEN